MQGRGPDLAAAFLLRFGEAELILSEIAMKLHELDLKDGGAP